MKKIFTYLKWIGVLTPIWLNALFLIFMPLADLLNLEFAAKYEAWIVGTLIVGNLLWFAWFTIFLGGPAHDMP